MATKTQQIQTMGYAHDSYAGMGPHMLTEEWGGPLVAVLGTPTGTPTGTPSASPSASPSIKRTRPSATKILEDICDPTRVVSVNHPDVFLVDAYELRNVPDMHLPQGCKVIIKIIPNYEKEDQLTHMFFTIGVGPCLYACIQDRELGRKYMILEYIQGDNMAQHYIKTKNYPGMKMHDLLSKISANGLYHQDLNPENIIVTSKGLRVIDFGKAKVGTTTSNDVAKGIAFMNMCNDFTGHIKALKKSQDETE